MKMEHSRWIWRSLVERIDCAAASSCSIGFANKNGGLRVRVFNDMGHFPKPPCPQTLFIMEKQKKLAIIGWVMKIAVALILLQTLFFKFTGAEESIYIFEKVGLGDTGRIGSGIAELVAAILILIPRSSWVGALMALGIITGAIVSHLTTLGIKVMGDGGSLFYLALSVFIGSMVVLRLERPNLMADVEKWRGKTN